MTETIVCFHRTLPQHTFLTFPCFLATPMVEQIEVGLPKGTSRTTLGLNSCICRAGAAKVYFVVSYSFTEPFRFFSRSCQHWGLCTALVLKVVRAGASTVHLCAALGQEIVILEEHNAKLCVGRKTWQPKTGQSQYEEVLFFTLLRSLSTLEMRGTSNLEPTLTHPS